jgi:hypothetical protein
MTTRKSTAVNIALLAVTAPIFLAGCGSDNDDVQQQGVCVDRKNLDDPDDDVRLDDSACSNGDHDYHGGGDTNPLIWYWLGTQQGQRFPAVGSTINYNVYHGSYAPPPSSVRVARGGVPKAGGAVTASRGGFGGGAKSGG